MLNQLCLIVNNWEDVFELKNTTAEKVILFRVTLKHQNLQQLFTMLYRSGMDINVKQKFSICFDFSSYLNEALLIKDIEAVASNIVFHPSFYIVQNSPCFFYMLPAESASGSFQQVLNKLSQVLTAQSFNTCTYTEISTAPKASGNCTNCMFYVEDKASLEKAGVYYVHQFLNKGTYNQYIYLHYLNKQWLKLAEEEWANAELKFASDNPVLFKTLTHLKKVSTENKLLSYQLKVCNEHLSNYKQYLQIMHTQDEANRINEFYYNEYEVLPLWYKRVGHILKVIMGKRTLRSLVVDDIKKYNH